MFESKKKLKTKIARLTDELELANHKVKWKDETIESLTNTKYELRAEIASMKTIYQTNETRLINENMRLKDELRLLKDANESLKKNVAFYIKERAKDFLDRTSMPEEIKIDV